MKHSVLYTINLLCTCLLLLILFTLPSCKKFLTIEKPVNQVISASVFTDSTSALAAINGMYVEIIRNVNSMLSGGITLYTGLASDELNYNGTVPAQLELNQNQVSESNNLINNSFWRLGFSFIYSSNAIIEGLEQSTSLSASFKQQATAEARFIRGISYFYLTSLFGDVPLLLSTNYSENSARPRAPASQVYNIIIEDLEFAKQHLPLAYPSAGRARPNQHTVSAFLARVNLYLGNYAEAESLATSVINSITYILEPNLNNVFLSTSKEAIWQLIPVNPSVNTWEGQSLIPSSATVRPSYSLSQGLFNAFESGDVRKTAWIKTNTVAGIPYPYSFKYKVRLNTVVTEYYIMIRLAEIYLIRAEARAQLNDVSGAQQDLNKIRNRASLPNTTASDQASLLTAIEKERRIELMVEWGHRWFDLKRTGRINDVLNYKPGWQPTDALFPIPLSELQLNPYLIQNPGY